MNRNHLTTLLLLAPAALAVPACLAPPDGDTDADEEIAAVEEPILGQLEITDCNNARALMLADSLRVGKWILDTPEFNTCMTSGRNGITYRACDEDDVETVAAGIQAARTTNAVELFCDSAAVSPVGGHADTESFSYSGQEEIFISSWSIDEANSNPSRLAGMGVIAGSIWHELMHQHGFQHGNSTASTGAQQAIDNRSWCGQSSTWIWNQHSMPYFLSDCLRFTIWDIAEARLAPWGHSQPALGQRAALIEAAMSRSHILSSAQLDDSALAVFWQRKLVASHSSKCIEVTGQSTSDGAAVKQNACVAGATNQRWVDLPLPASTPAGAPLRHLLMNLNSGKCLDRPNGNVANGTLLQQHTCHAGAAQIFIARSNGQWEALGTSGQPSNQCLDIPSHSQNNNVQLQMSNCKTSDISNQTFNLVF